MAHKKPEHLKKGRIINFRIRLSVYEEFKKKAFDNLAEDGGGYLVYVANSRVNLQLAEERYPDIKFSSTREL